MNYFQRLCRFCDYRWLWILVIITSVIATKAEQNSFKDFFDTYFVNITDFNEESLNRVKTNKIVLNTTQRSVSRPSTVLKQLWSSASKADNVSNDNNSDSSQSFAVKLKDFLFRPTKWSSDIVPSIPLNLQLSSDAIKLSPHLKESKSTTSGDITVINGFSSPISYPPKDYKIVNRNQQNSIESKLNVLNTAITPSSRPLIPTTERHAIHTPSSLESIKNEVTLPFFDVRINATSVPLFNHTIPTKIITTTATIMSSTEPQRRKGELYTTPKLTTFHSLQTTHGLTQKPKLTQSELRRLAIRQRFGTRDFNFGARISRTPPKVSIDNFLSVYKPAALKNNFISIAIKSRINETQESPNKQNSTKILKNSENISVKPKLLSFNQTKEMPVKSQTNQTKDYLMTTENRHSLSSLLLFPSRPTPFLKPRLSNAPGDMSGLKEFLEKNPIKLPQRNTNNSNNGDHNNHNISAEDISERRIDDQLIESVSKKNLFGYRKKVIDNSKNKNHFNEKSNSELNGEYIEVPSAQGLPLESIMNPQISSEEMPLVIGEDHQYIPSNELMGAHKHYLNQLKLKEENLKYTKLPNPDLFKEQLNKPEEQTPTFNIRPVDSHYYRNSKKIKPTLPNKMMQFQEMMRHLASVLTSINRLTPMGRTLSDKYKEITSKLKFDLMANKSKGPYARYYPPGPYDDIYSPDPVEEKYRRSDEDIPTIEVNERLDRMPDNYTSIDRMDDINTDNNNSYAFNDYDDDGLIKKSFGYRVTVYRSPEKGDSNVTEEVLDDDNDLNSNKSDDLSVSESSDDFSVTTDTNNNGTEYLMTSASNLLRGESQSGLKGNAKGIDYKRNKYDREKGSHAKEEVNVNKSKKVDTHERKANNERALKERTIIEFFEREHILDSAYNKDKLGVDKSDTHKANEDQHTSGSMTKTVTIPEQSITKNGTLSAGEVHQYANSDQNHVTNAHTFDTIFPEHDRKYKHKDNAHKYKGWKERGYKIITETEFVDRGRKVDTGYKKHINGSKEHIKEHSAGDVTKADFRKYNKTMKNINKNYEALYGQRVKSPQNNYGKSRDTILMNADDYRKYYYNKNNGITSGESQVSEEHKPYDSTQQTEQTVDPTSDPIQVPTHDPTYDPMSHTSEKPLEQLQTVGITSGDVNQEISTPEEELTSTEGKSTENISEKTHTDDDPNDRFTTDNFQAPPVDTENYWRPITSNADQFSNNREYYPKPRPYNNYINYNNDYNNVYANDNTNENYEHNFEGEVNAEININKGIPTISSDSYGLGNNPYSMPLVSEEVHSYPTNGAGINPNEPQLYNNNEYFYEAIPTISANRRPNEYTTDRQKKKNKHLNNSFEPSNEANNENLRNYHKIRSNNTNESPIFDAYPQQQLTPNYPTIMELMPTAQAPIPTDQPFYNYQVYPPEYDQNQLQNQLGDIPDGRPLFGIIGDESKKVEQVNNHNLETVRNRKTTNQLKENAIDSQKAQNTKGVNQYTQTLTTPITPPNNNINKHNYIKPIRINTMIPSPIPVPPISQPVNNRKPNSSKKRRKRPPILPPFMNPTIGGLFMNSNPMQTYLGPEPNFPLHFKMPFKFRSTALPPTQMFAFTPNLSGPSDQPIAILHPNKMLTLTTTSLLRNRLNEHFVSPKKLTNPLHLAINRKISRNRRRQSSKRTQQSTPLKNKLFPQKLRKKRRSFKEIFSFRNWFKSKFES